MKNTKLNDEIEIIFKEFYKKLFKILLNKYSYKYFDVIEDSIQETFLIALSKWDNEKKPENEFGWFYTVSDNKIKDYFRKNNKIIKLESNVVENIEFDSNLIDKSDEIVKMTLFIMGLDLNIKNKFCITFKLITGFTNKHIAEILDLSEENVKKIISRTKNILYEKIKNKNFNDEEINLNTNSQLIMECLYGIFNEAYFSNYHKDLIIKELAFEVLKIIELLINSKYFKDKNKYALYALYSLCLFHFARFNSRKNSKNYLIKILEQNRELWDKEIINLALYYLKSSMNNEYTTMYHIESRIIAEYVLYDNFNEFNWKNIISNYEKLLLFKDNFYTNLNLVYAKSNLENEYDIDREIVQLNPESNNEMFYFYSFLADYYIRNDEFTKSKENYEIALNYAKNEYQKNFIKNILDLSLF